MQPVSETKLSPSRVRHRVILVSMLMAFILYLDRVCLGELVKTDAFINDFGASRDEIGRVLGAFFLTYALMQIPAGWASDRFGARRMLTVYIVLWSLATGLTGLATTLGGLLFFRLACGVAQAGAYPTSGGVIRQWFPLNQRGFASACVSLGGRLGGTLAPLITSLLIVGLGAWRPVLGIYFAVGIGIAMAYWWVVRDRPSMHPGVNQAEAEHIGLPADQARPSIGEFFPMLWACCNSRSLWLSSLAQYSINIGWTFLITWLPTYLVQSQGVDVLTSGMMVSLVLGVGIPGQILGGWLVDRMVERFGLRWGRVVPVAVSSFIAGLAYLSCLMLQSPWPIVIACAVVSMMTDIGNPAFWAFVQDVGGRSTAAIYGWGNMWGNLGASSSAVMVPTLLAYGQSSGTGQTLVFTACASSFFIASLAVLGMDATKPIIRRKPQ